MASIAVVDLICCVAANPEPLFFLWFSHVVKFSHAVSVLDVALFFFFFFFNLPADGEK